MPKDMGGGEFSIKAEVSECMAFFDGLNVNKTQIQKRLMKVTGRGAVQAAKRGISRTLRNRTGNLKKGMTYTMDWKGNYVKIYSSADSGKATQRAMGRNGLRVGKARNARYGFILASGFEATATSSWGMRFQVGGEWKTRHSLKVGAKDWLEPSVIRYVDSNELDIRLEKEFQNQINYWEKRITGGNLK